MRKRKYEIVDLSQYITDGYVEITGDDLYKINGGGQIEGAESLAEANKPRSTVTDGFGNSTENYPGAYNLPSNNNTDQKVGGGGNGGGSGGGSGSGSGNPPGGSGENPPPGGNESGDGENDTIPLDEESIGNNQNEESKTDPNKPFMKQTWTNYYNGGTYIPVEGLGILSGSSIKNVASLTRDDKLVVNTFGRYAASHLVDRLEFYGSITLKIDGEKVEKKTITKPNEGAIWDSSYIYVGEVRFDSKIPLDSKIQIVSDVDMKFRNFGGLVFVDYLPDTFTLKGL